MEDETECFDLKDMDVLFAFAGALRHGVESELVVKFNGRNVAGHATVMACTFAIGWQRKTKGDSSGFNPSIERRPLSIISRGSV